MTSEKEIYIEIKKAIIKGKLRPNTQLIEIEMSEVFGVSRTPVRNVFRRLAHENLVKIIPNRGTYISSPTKEEVKEVFDMREILETEAVRRLCNKMDEKHYLQLKSLIDKEDKARKEGRLHEVLEITCDFHLKVAEFAGNAYSYRYIKELVSLNYVIMALYGHRHLDICGFQEHKAILNALKQKKEKIAVNLMAEHLKDIVISLNLEENSNQFLNMKEVFKNVNNT